MNCQVEKVILAWRQAVSLDSPGYESHCPSLCSGKKLIHGTCARTGSFTVGMLSFLGQAPGHMSCHNVARDKTAGRGLIYLIQASPLIPDRIFDREDWGPTFAG